MIDKDDFVYERSPLIEVVVELRWELLTIASIPNGAVDPLFPSSSKKFADGLAQRGFSNLEMLVPAGTPLETLPHVAVRRYRKSTDAWPAFQIGPGVFTVNMVPPYEGWDDMRSSIQIGLEVLSKSFGTTPDFFKIFEINLRYINGFSDSFSKLAEMNVFAERHLGFSASLPERVIQEMADTSVPIVYSGEARFKPKTLEDTTMIIKVSPGYVNKSPSVITEYVIMKTDGDFFNKSVEECIGWLDEAHNVIRQTFQLMTSDKLKAAMGPMRSVKVRQQNA